MKKDENLINFKLTEDMFLELIKFSEIKNKISNLDNNKKNKEKIIKLEKQLEIYKRNFIKEFKKNNINEIEEYLKLKDQ